MTIRLRNVFHCNNVQSTVVPCRVSNPLIQTAALTPQYEESCAPSRFGFFTDPMTYVSVLFKQEKGTMLAMPSVVLDLQLIPIFPR